MERTLRHTFRSLPRSRGRIVRSAASSRCASAGTDIIAPSRRFRPDISEKKRIRSAMHAYGVRVRDNAPLDIP